MYCDKCGASISEGNNFCDKCGAEIKRGVENGVEKSWLEKNSQSRKKILAAVCGLAVIFIIFFVFGSSNKNIDIVRKGNLTYYPDVTVKEAFDNWFSSPKWSYDSNTQLVEFKGGCLWDGKTATATIEFRTYEDDSFEIDSIKMSDKYDTIYLTETEWVRMLIDIFDDAYITKGIEPPSDLRDMLNASYFLDWIFN